LSPGFGRAIVAGGFHVPKIISISMPWWRTWGNPIVNILLNPLSNTINVNLTGILNNPIGSLSMNPFSDLQRTKRIVCPPIRVILPTPTIARSAPAAPEPATPWTAGN